MRFSFRRSSRSSEVPPAAPNSSAPPSGATLLRSSSSVEGQPPLRRQSSSSASIPAAAGGPSGNNSSSSAPAPGGAIRKPDGPVRYASSIIPPNSASAPTPPLKSAPSSSAIDDPFMGGALSREDLFDILRMEMETLAAKAGSLDGLKNTDLKPLVKAIADLRSVGYRQDDNVIRAVDFQMKMTGQLVAQSEIKAALASKEFSAMKDANQKIRQFGIKTRAAKQLQAELALAEKDIVREVQESHERMMRENGGGSSSKRKSMLPGWMGGGRPVNSAGGGNGEMDELMLTDAPPSTPAVIAPPRVLPKPPVVEALAGGSSLALSGVAKELEEKKTQMHRAILVDTMRRVKTVLDSPDRAAGAIVAAGANVEHVMGDLNVVHLYIGDLHGKVMAEPAVSVNNNSPTIFIGTIDSKNSQQLQEIHALRVSGNQQQEIDKLLAKIKTLEAAAASTNLDPFQSNKPPQSPRSAGPQVREMLRQRASSASRATTAAEGSAEDFEKYMNPDDMSVDDLRAYIKMQGGDSSSITERAELVETAKSLMIKAAEVAKAKKEAAAAAEAAAAKEASKASEGLAVKDDPKYAQYFKMMAVGVPKEAVRLKILKDGVLKDDAFLDWNPDLPAPVSKISKVSEDPRYKEYFRMVSFGVPLAAIKYKMETKGLDPDIIDMDPNAPVPGSNSEEDSKSPETGEASATAEAPQKIKIIDHVQYSTYIRMLSVGVPRSAVEFKMKQEGLDVSVLDMDPQDEVPESALIQTPAAAAPPAKKKTMRTSIPGQTWKKIHWTLARNTEGDSVWTVNTDFALQEKEKEEIARLFSMRQQQPATTPEAVREEIKAKEQQLAAQAAELATRPIQLIDTSRANTLGILLSRFSRVTFAHIREMIATLELAPGLNGDDVRTILSFLPTSEEAEKLRPYASDPTANLSPPDRHFLNLLDIPRLPSRVSSLLFKLKFFEMVSDIEFDLNALHVGIKALTESTALPSLLAMILAMGNDLNSFGGALTPEEDGFKPAKGFELSTLAKLRHAKAYENPKVTALHVLVQIAQERQSQVLTFVNSEGTNLRAASGVSVSHVKSQLKSLAVGVKALEVEIKGTEETKETPEDEVFYNAAKAFHSKAHAEVMSLSGKVTKAEQEFSALVHYLGEDPEITTELLFKAFVNFFEDVKTCLSENELAATKSRNKQLQNQPNVKAPPRTLSRTGSTESISLKPVTLRSAKSSMEAETPVKLPTPPPSSAALSQLEHRLDSPNTSGDWA